MKKYVKPELFYERYELSQHIADCQWEMNLATKEACEALPDQDPFFLPLDWGKLFIEDSRCTITDWQQYCYQPGNAADIKVFIS